MCLRADACTPIPSNAAAVYTRMSPPYAPATGDLFASVNLLQDPRRGIGTGRRGAGIGRFPPERTRRGDRAAAGAGEDIGIERENDGSWLWTRSVARIPYAYTGFGSGLRWA
jgi:hypothetical protein